MGKDTILVFCAHGDDDVIGAGGTLFKYADEGKEIVTIIFTYGEKSTPHIKEEIITKTRVEESNKVDKLIGKKSIFLGLKEGGIEEDIEKLNIKDKIKELINKYKPSKIYTLSASDPHKHHRLVNKVITEVLEEMKYKNYELYAYEVWNVINENAPKVYVNITPYFRKKIQAMKIYKSQRHYIFPLWLPVYARARMTGIKNNCKYAEMFYKLK